MWIGIVITINRRARAVTVWQGPIAVANQSTMTMTFPFENLAHVLSARLKSIPSDNFQLGHPRDRRYRQ